MSRSQRALLLALVVVACSDGVPAPLALFGCPWSRKGDVRLADAPEGICWRLACPAGMAVTLPSGDACAAAQSAQVTVWPPNQLLASWVTWSSSGDLHVNAAPVPCLE